MFISIITPALQSGAFLGDAIESVWAQRDGAPPFEHIIVDGGSTDNTMEIVSRYDHLHVISEPDRGTSDAVNKGLARAKGNYILLLMADDRLGTGVLMRLAEAVKKSPDAKVWTFGTLLFQLDSDGNEQCLEIVQSPEQTVLSLINVLYRRPLLHSRFICRSVYDQLGGFHIDCPLSNDREFMVRCVLAGIKEKRLEGLLYELRVHSGSATMNADRRNVLTYLGEHLDWSKRFLENCDLSLEDHKTLYRWRFHEMVRIIYYQLRGKYWRKALVMGLRTVVEYSFWPLELVRLVSMRARMHSCHRHSKPR